MCVNSYNLLRINNEIPWFVLQAKMSKICVVMRTEKKPVFI